MGYLALDQLSFAPTIMASGLSMGRALTDSSDQLLFAVGDDICIVDPEKWQAWDVKALRKPYLMQHGLRIEPDISSAFDPQIHYAANGTFAIGSGEQSLFVSMHASGMWRQARSLIDGHSESRAPAEVAFSRWAIATGNDNAYRIVREFDVGRTDKPVD